MAFHKTNRSAYVNYLRAKYETYTHGLVARSLPYHLCLDPSDRCQLRCPTCPTGIENESRRTQGKDATLFRRERSALAPDLFHAMMDELGEFLFLINFYNYGEPLLNNNLASYVARAHTLDIETEIHTNLSLPLSDESIDALLGAGLDRLCASIDGFSRETYEVHRVGGDLDLVKSNLERFAGARDRLGLETEITYNFLVFRFNQHEIPATRAYCERLGIEFNPRDAFIDNPDWLPTHRQHEQPRFVPENVRLKPDAEMSWWGTLPEPQESRCPSACGWHHGFTVVTAGGAVAPCCAVAKDRDDFGTVVPGQVRFGDIWNNDRYRASRAAFAPAGSGHSEQVETVCTTCPYPRFLHHLYSVHDAKVLTQFHQTFKGTDPVLEHAFDLLSVTRYALPLVELARSGPAHPMEQLFVGDENEQGTAGFLTFVEANLGFAEAAHPPVRREVSVKGV